MQSSSRLTSLAKSALYAPNAALQAAGLMGTDNWGHQGRSLQRWVARQAWFGLLPQLYEFDVNYLNAKDYTKEKWMSHAALLPHEVFATLYDKAPDLFRHLMYGTEENLIKFWAGLERTDGEFCRNHPVVQNTQPNRRIPIGIHGDDAGTAGRHCVLGIMQLGIVCGGGDVTVRA